MNNPLQPKVARLLPSADSTNAVAITAINGPNPPAAGAVFMTETQTAGRGQGSNRWHATPGDNLTLSVVLYPDHLALDLIFVLNQLASLAVAETVRAYLPSSLAASVTVKWPNDVYVGNQKIAGILIQNGLRGSNLAWSVIGIGLNVNEHCFPAELTETATSLSLLTGSPVDRADVLATLFQQLTKVYELTAREHLTQLDRIYHEQLYLTGVRSTFRQIATGRTFKATIIGVTREGHLRLRTQTGERRFALREIGFVR